jgi:hypothetical protein
MTNAHQVTKHLKLLPYKFQVVHQLQEFSIAIHFIVLCMKRIMCGS